MWIVLTRVMMSIAALKMCAGSLKGPRVALRQMRPLSQMSQFEAAGNGGGRQYHGGSHARQGGSSRLFLLGGAAMTAGVAYGQNKAHLSASAEGAEGAGFLDTALYKPTKPIQTGKVKVSDIHTIAFTVYGSLTPGSAEKFHLETLENAKNSILEVGVSRFDYLKRIDVESDDFLLVEVYRHESPLEKALCSCFRV